MAGFIIGALATAAKAAAAAAPHVGGALKTVGKTMIGTSPQQQAGSMGAAQPSTGQMYAKAITDAANQPHAQQGASSGGPNYQPAPTPIPQVPPVQPAFSNELSAYPDPRRRLFGAQDGTVF